MNPLRRYRLSMGSPGSATFRTIGYYASEADAAAAIRTFPDAGDFSWRLDDMDPDPYQPEPTRQA